MARSRERGGPLTTRSTWSRSKRSLERCAASSRRKRSGSASSCAEQERSAAPDPDMEPDDRPGRKRADLDEIAHLIDEPQAVAPLLRAVGATPSRERIEDPAGVAD